MHSKEIQKYYQFDASALICWIQSKPFKEKVARLERRLWCEAEATCVMPLITSLNATASEASDMPNRKQAEPMMRPSGEQAMLASAQKSSPRKNRGVPPPATFDIDTLPGSANLTALETAAVLRRTPGALEIWRRDDDHPLKWTHVDGRPLYRVDNVRAYMKLDLSKKKRSKSKRP